MGLWTSQDDQAEQTKVILCPLLRDLARHQNPNQWTAVSMLFHADMSERGENREFLRPILHSFAQDPTHPNHWQALFSLWNEEGKEQRHQNRQQFFPNVLAVANDPKNPNQGSALFNLWYAEELENTAIHTDLRPHFLTLFENSTRLGSWDILGELWNLSDAQQTETRARLRSQFIKIAQDVTHPSRFRALGALWNSGGEQEAMNRVELQPILVDIAITSPRDVQQQAIRLLRESNDQAMQELGLALHLQHFCPNFSKALEERIAGFNPETFRQHARPSLADLSGEEMDLVGEFEALMNLIDPRNEKSSFYLQAAAITGHPEDSHLTPKQNKARLQAIQYKARGFLKFLTGQPLTEGESAGWQIHDENKPALINALKHIIKALKRTEDPATIL